MKYTDEILETFVELANQIRKEDPVMRLLPKLGEEIKKHVEKVERAIVYGALGYVYWSILNYKDKAENCEKAIKAYEETLNIYTKEEFPEVYQRVERNLSRLLDFCKN